MVENLYIHFREREAFKAIRDHHAHARFANEPEGLLIQGECGAVRPRYLNLHEGLPPHSHAREYASAGLICEGSGAGDVQEPCYEDSYGNR